MGRPAVPKYLKKHVLDGQNEGLIMGISPGQRFGLLFPFWNEQDWSADQQDRSKINALQQVLSLDAETRAILDAIVSRQRLLAEKTGERTVCFEAVSTAPFMTGIGNEHPLENGFSFLPPYGLPYLPASAVKGILRRSAEQLASGAFGDTTGWQYPYIWMLFGFEAASAYLKPGSQLDPAVSEIAAGQQAAYEATIESSERDDEALQFFMKHVLTKEQLQLYLHNTPLFMAELGVQAETFRENDRVDPQKVHFQGALRFWDVFPVPGKKAQGGAFLTIDILTPHYMDYYQKNQTPADCGQPVPNPFLTITPGSRFRFFVECNGAAFPHSLKTKWKDLLRAAFDHAFDWLGFGAKTAVGYGQMDLLSGGHSPKKDDKAAEAHTDLGAAKKPESTLNKLLSELKMIKPIEKGRLGTIIQKIESLDTQDDKKKLAMAIRDKLGEKEFKKHKKREMLQELIDS